MIGAIVTERIGFATDADEKKCLFSTWKNAVMIGTVILTFREMPLNVFKST
jgi:hypothetical protein